MRDLRLTGLDTRWNHSLRSGVNRAGRSPENELHLPEPSVSGFHCELHVSEQSILVKDLDSTNGTFIDGQRVQEALLQPGQVLQRGFVALGLVEEPVQIAIPALTVEQAPASVPLQDGTLSCHNHPTAQASFRCTQCGRVFCEACVHLLRLTGGKTRTYCPDCSGPCERIPGIEPVRPKKKSLLARLTQTLRLRLK